MPTATTAKYRWIGNFPWEAQVGDLRVMVEPGGFVELTKADLDNEYNAEVLDDGLLIPVGEGVGDK